MAETSYDSRRELEQYGFPLPVTVLAPVVCVVVGALLPRVWAPLDLLDLPLVATVFFAVSRRSPIRGTLTGTAIGLLQDALTGLPLGVNGIAKAVIGYVGSSIGFAVDVENVLNRLLMNFVASLLESGMLYVITRRLLGDGTVGARPGHELLRALVNTAVALPIFLVLDRFRIRE